MKNVAIIPASVFTFLKALKKNNNREWFAKNKDRFLAEQEALIAFVDAVLPEMNKHDVLENESGKKSLFRIYRDVRFSKDKAPFKTHFAGSFRRATKARRGSYYFHIEPGNCFAGGGFWEPSPEDLKRIRDEFSADPEPMRKILKAKTFKSYFGELYGEQLKTTPKGFQPDDPAIDLLRYKQFAVIRNFKDEEVLSPGFVKELNATFKAMRPFLDYMSDVLTTDVNGESIL
jgi:uncharacterized protein (TIGR02453 family)